MLNDRGFETEVVDCDHCGDQFYCSPADPHDLCECPNCVELESSSLSLQDSLCDLIMIPRLLT